MNNTIWCLLMDADEYNQPLNNLLAVWRTKPSLDKIASALKRPFPCDTDEETLAVVNLFEGREVRIRNFDYGLYEIDTGFITLKGSK